MGSSSATLRETAGPSPASASAHFARGARALPPPQRDANRRGAQPARRRLSSTGGAPGAHGSQDETEARGERQQIGRRRGGQRHPITGRRVAKRRPPRVERLARVADDAEQPVAGQLPAQGAQEDLFSPEVELV